MTRRALIVFGGWEGHTPKECAELFQAELTQAGFEVEMSQSLEVYADTEKLASKSLIVPVWTAGEISGEQLNGLAGAVQSGVGLAGFHGGIIDAFRGSPKYQFMTGGQWVAHPGNNIPSYDVRLRPIDHPITRGLSDFTLTNTEQYYMHVDPGVQVLAETTFSGEYEPEFYPAGTVMPYAWTRPWGQGRVFVAAWGHTYKDFDVPAAKEMVKRGMLWAARVES